MKLYCFGESGHSYKVALSLALSGIDWTVEYVDFFKGGTRTPEFLAINRMGECPVLVDGDEALAQSGVILTHLSRRTGKFGGTTEQERDEVLRWLLWDNHKLSSQAGTLRFQRNFVPSDKVSPDVLAFVAQRLQTAFKTLERHLEGRDWIVGDNLTNADLSCCSYLYYPEPFGFDRKDFPNIDRWLDRIAALPGWKHPYDMMPRAWHGA